MRNELANQTLQNFNTRHLQQHRLHVVLVAHLKVLDAGNRDAAVEVEAVSAGDAR